jgi:signal transduction histidine kinase
VQVRGDLGGGLPGVAPAVGREHSLQHRLRAQMSREAIHDLNNQLAVILNYAGFVLEDLPADDPRREDVVEIRRAAERARDIALRLLAPPPTD